MTVFVVLAGLELDLPELPAFLEPTVLYLQCPVLLVSMSLISGLLIVFVSRQASSNGVFLIDLSRRGFALRFGGVVRLAILL